MNDFFLIFTDISLKSVTDGPFDIFGSFDGLPQERATNHKLKQWFSSPENASLEANA